MRSGSASAAAWRALDAFVLDGEGRNAKRTDAALAIFDEACTRYLDVVIRAECVDGYEIGQETCTDGSLGRDLPTR